MIQPWRDRRVLGSLLVALVLVVVMVATEAADRSPGRLERIWREVLAPIEGIVAHFTHQTEGWVSDVVRFPSIVREHAALRERVTELTRAETRLALLERENRRLREALDLQRAIDPETRTATVSRRLPSNWTRQVTIDLGDNDGVQRDDVVVVPAGLVGRVIITTPNTSQVMLITSPESGLGVEVVGTGDVGVAVGDIGREDLLRVTFFDPSAEVFVGDIMVTSGLGEIYPPGIPVCEVVEVSVEGTGLLREVWARPVADLNRLFEVLVIEKIADEPIGWFP